MAEDGGSWEAHPCSCSHAAAVQKVLRAAMPWVAKESAVRQASTLPARLPFPGAPIT